MIWSFDSLWAKASAYIGRAQAEPREGTMFALMSFIGLEFLGRATLARVHPALLADPHAGSDGLLHAFGHAEPSYPRSIPAAEVFARCHSVVDRFTKDYLRRCKELVEYRNEELHSGGDRISRYSTHLWLADYYEICTVLLESQGKSLEDLFGPETAASARKMLDRADEETRSAVKEEIGRAQAAFEALSPEDQEERRARAARMIAAVRWIDDTEYDCPACQSKARIKGELVSEEPPRLKDGQFVKRRIYIPVGIKCHGCGLELEGPAKLQAAARGGEFSLDWLVGVDELDEIDAFREHYEWSRDCEAEDAMCDEYKDFLRGR